MFSQTFVDTVGSSRNPWSLITSLAIQTLGIGVLILIPLTFTESLPFRELSEVFTLPPPPAARPVTVVSSAKPASTTVQRQFDPRKLTAPPQIPQQVAMINDDSFSVIGAISSTGDPASQSSGFGNIIGGNSALLLPDAPPPKPVMQEKIIPEPPSRITVGGKVQGANLIHRVEPIYPKLAVQTRVSGTVRFTAVIGRDGTIQNLQMVSGHPLLFQAARDAVKQWLYKPTLLNGQPVEVATQIDVNFVLGGR